MKYFLTLFFLSASLVFGQTITGQRLQLGSTGVLFTQSNGSLTIAGTGNGTDENLVFNFNSANVVTLSSGTGVTTINASGLAFTTTGVITGVGTGLTGTAAGLTAGTAAAVAVGGITGLGTGVATALALNVGSDGAFVTFNGAGGTPSSLTGTNITGTAAGLTAGTVTTIPNLTGHITSTGNTTVLGSFTIAQLNTAVSDANLARIDAGQAFVGNQTITGDLDVSGALSAGSMDIDTLNANNFIFSEGAAPATPGAGTVAVYAKADGLVYGKDDAGTETILSGGAGAVDTTAVIGSKTWSDGSTDTGVWTWNRATGTDPTITFLSGGIGVQSLTNAALTSGRVAIAGASGILADDADFTFATDTLTVTKLAAHLQTGTKTLDENASVALDPAGSADGKYSGITVAGTAGADLAFGDLIYLDPTDSRWELADANSAAAADGDARGMIGVCVNDPSGDGQPVVVLLQGIVRADAVFPALTINATLFVSETAGDITHTAPTTEDNVVRHLGAAMTADEIYFNPSYSWITYDAP